MLLAGEEQSSAGKSTVLGVLLALSCGCDSLFSVASLLFDRLKGLEAEQQMSSCEAD